MVITLELVRDTWKACYSAERLALLYDTSKSALEVLTRKDGPWARVPYKDRLWTVLREGVLTDKQLRLVAVSYASRALRDERKAGREPDPRSWEAVKVAKKFANGKATEQELSAAESAAWSAAWSAAPSAAWSAARAAESAAWSAAQSAAQSAAPSAAPSAARSAAQEWQVKTLVKLLLQK